MNMIERLGRALSDIEGDIDADMFYYPYESRKDSYDALARAALEAMKIPTEAMVKSGLNCDAWSNAEGGAARMLADTFSAMISKALEGEE